MNKPLSILYVDDYPLDRELVRDILEKEHGGFQITEAASRREFEARLVEKEYDLVLSDFNILGFEGLDVIDAVQAQDPRVPVVIVTGTGSEEIAVEALKRGAADYVIKTLQYIRRLPHTLHTVIENRRLADALQEQTRALRESDARYRAVVEDQTELICRFQPDGTLTFVNDAYCRYFDREREDLVGQSFLSLIFDEEQEFVTEQFSSLSVENPIVTYDHRVLMPDGTMRWQRWTDRAIFDPQGRLYEFQAVGRDITERVRIEAIRRQAEQALWESQETLKASEEYTRNIIESSLDMIISSDMERRIVGFNTAAEKTFGYRRDEVIGEHVDILYADPREGLIVHKTAVREGECVREIINRRKNGEVFPAYTSVSILRDANDEIVGVMGVTRDITERVRTEAIRRQAEKALRESERKLQTLLDATTDVAFLAESDGTFLAVNDALAKSVGRKKEELDGRTMFELASTQIVESSGAMLQKIITSKKPFQGESEHAGRYYDNSIYPILDDNGNVKQIAVFARDITERKRMKEALRESEARYRVLFEQASDAIFLENENDEIIDVNRRACELLGYTRQELLTMTVSDLQAPEARGQQGHIIKGELTRYQGIHFESIDIHRDSTRIPVEVSTSRIVDTKGELILSIVRDITERKQMEELTHTQRDLALAISVTLELDEVLRLCLETAISISGMDCGGIYLVDRASGALDLVFHENLPPDFVNSASHYEADSPSAQLVMAGQPVYSEHLQMGVPVDEVKRRENLRAAAILPVRHEDRVIACLNIASHTLDDVPTFTRTALEAVAAQIGSAIARVRAEEALRESEERLHMLVQNMPVLIDAIDAEGNFVLWNRECERVTGYSAEKIIGNPKAMELLSPDSEHLYQMIAEAAAHTADFHDLEWDIKRRDGGVRTVSWANMSNQVPIPGWAQWAVGVDITERKQAENALREAEVRYRTVADFTYDWEYWESPDGTLRYVSPACERVTGYTVDQFIANPHLLDELVLPKDVQAWTGHRHAASKKPRPREIQFRIRRRDGETVWIEHVCQPVVDEHGAFLGYRASNRDITERKRMEDALQRRNRQLATLNRTSQALVSILDLDQVLASVLEEVRGLLDMTASSVWLIDSETNDLVCQQVTGPQSELVRGWRLAPGQGFAGWVAHSGVSLLVSDARVDKRYFEGVEQQTGLGLHSILTVPLRVRNGVIGVLQVMDAETDRFSTTDLELLEPLATSIAIAIDNAQLYEQAQRDAETKATLLREVNHRVKNNLTGIVGLLHSARDRVIVNDQEMYHSAMDDLIGRVRGLATVHSLLSASGWSPVRLSDVATRIINAALQPLARGKRVSVDVPLSPVRVASDQAHNLALVINELATNVAKYACVEKEPSTVQVTFHISLNDCDVVRCEFRDNGPGYPDDVLQLKHHGVGFSLIKHITRRSLRGELTLDNDDGAVAVIQFQVKV